jgi:hypothetical protein
MGIPESKYRNLGGQITLSYEHVAQMKCTEINQLPEEQIDEIVEVVIDHYYAVGFPYYPIIPEKIEKEYNYLYNFDVSKLDLPDNHIQQNMAGLNTVNTFHPEMWTTRCRNSKTPMEIFKDRALFKKALRKRIKYSITRLIDYNIRKSLKAFGGQAVSNFRPTVAKWVYERFCPAWADVLDPCMGYGGRLMGAFCTSKIASYTGIDPCQEVLVGNIALQESLIRASGRKEFPQINMEKLPFEDYRTDSRFDLVFTSPPYFDIEKYSDEDTQSYKRYPVYKDWKEKFLWSLISHSHLFLKTEGYMVLNVGAPIDKDAFEIGMLIFGTKPEIYHMRLSKLLGRGNKNEVSHKTEPIFVWKKA